jgi:exopolysaccharide biosynthesis polyprenyl glycosylphosphotransferase
MSLQESGAIRRAGALSGEVHLPRVDVRTLLDERAFRGWTQSSRRAVRIAGLVISDIVAGLIGILTVEYTWLLVSSGGRRPMPDEVPLLAMIFCLQPLALRVAGAYSPGARRDILKVGGGICMAALLGWLQAQLFGRTVPDLPNKTAYVYSATLITAYAWIFRVILDRLVVAGYRAGILQRRVLMVGSREEAQELHRQCTETIGCELRVIGRLDPEADGVTSTAHVGADDVPDMGTLDALERALSETGAQGVIVSSGLPITRLEAVVNDCFSHGASVAVLPSTLKRLSATQIEVRRSTVGTLLQLQPIRLDVPQLAVKRALDLLLTTIGLALIWPLLAIIAIAIRLDSPGPVLFRQERVGQGGRRFEILKFRTMVARAAEQRADLQHLNEYADGRLFKIKNDPRITRLGRFLRRMSLDELPQLWNVLRGEMSLVGPRPCMPDEFTQYLPHHMTRLFVLPGVTGPWQVSGRNQITDFEEVIRLDREYIENWSIFIDASILLRTVPALFARGAY